MKKLKIGLFLLSFNKDYNRITASYWIRVYDLLDAYRKFNCDVTINNPFKLYDIVIYYRTPVKILYIFLLLFKIISKKTYIDINVNYFEIHKHTNEKQVRFLRKIAGICDGIICSTDSIAMSAKKYNKHIHVMDDPINLNRFKNIKTSFNFSPKSNDCLTENDFLYLKTTFTQF